MQDGDGEKGNVRYDKQVGGMRINFKDGGMDELQMDVDQMII